MSTIFDSIGIDPGIIIIALMAIVVILIGVMISNGMRLTRLERKYKMFMKGSDAQSLEKTFVRKFAQIDRLYEAKEDHEHAIKTLEQHFKVIFSKYGVEKYDAFDDVGGKLSFALALLDKDNSGIILNAVHSRDNCFLYLKEIVKGESYVMLSQEEVEALRKAVNFELGEMSEDEKNLEKYADQEIEFVISEFNPKRRRIIGDRKQLIVAEKAEKQKELFAKISVGDTVEGVVKNVTDFGAFIDLGGADGLLHISEMSWGRVENPKKVFKVGENVKVLIKDIAGDKIALSMKFPEANPWNNAAEKYAVGTVVSGKVARMTDFGAFVELEAGVDALLHVSQISRVHVEKPADFLKIGQVIEAKVVDFNEEDKKISLSMKVLEPEAAPAEEATEE